MMSVKSLAPAGLLFITTPVWAGESLIDGQGLEYNRAYNCNGERIIIARCRDNDDESYCQVVYPDRPLQNGMQVAPVEMRGDIIAKLNACSRIASAPARAEAPAASASSYAATGKPPGIGKASWQLIDYDEESATFFTKAGIKRSGNSADGWFTVVYVRPKDVPGTDLKGVQYFQMHYLANCAKGTARVGEGAYLDEDGKVLGGALISEAQAPFEQPKQGTLNGEQLNVVCGKPHRPINKDPIDTDGLGLIFIYHGLLQQDGLM